MPSPRTVPSCLPVAGWNSNLADFTGPFSSSEIWLYLLSRSLAAFQCSLCTFTTRRQMGLDCPCLARKEAQSDDSQIPKFLMSANVPALSRRDEFVKVLFITFDCRVRPPLFTSIRSHYQRGVLSSRS